MKINSLLETITVSSNPDQGNGGQAPKFGRSNKVLEDDTIEETTSGCVASVDSPTGTMQRRAKGSMFAGISTSEKYPNSKAVKEEQINEVDPRNFDSDEDYYRARNAPAKARSHARQSPGVNQDDEAYFREIFRKKRLAAQQAERSADHDRLATGTNEGEVEEGQQWPDTSTSLAKRKPVAAFNNQGVKAGRPGGMTVSTRVDPTITPTSVKRLGGDRPIPSFLQKEGEEMGTFAALKDWRVWDVTVMNNYYRGKYADYGARHYSVVASSPEEARQVVLNNPDYVLQDLLSRKLQNGKKVLPRGSALPVEEKRVGDAKPGTITTMGLKKMLTPDGVQSFKFAGGKIVDGSHMAGGEEQAVAEGWKEDAEAHDEFLAHARQQLQAAHPKERPALAVRLSNLEKKHFGDEVGQGWSDTGIGRPSTGLSAGIEGILNSIGNINNTSQSSVQNMPFGSVTTPRLSPEQLAAHREQQRVEQEEAARREEQRREEIRSRREQDQANGEYESDDEDEFSIDEMFNWYQSASPEQQQQFIKHFAKKSQMGIEETQQYWEYVMNAGENAVEPEEWKQMQSEVNENLSQPASAVDAKGRTQQQWMQAVKAKFPDAKIMRSKMIDGPCQATLSDGRKLSWNKVEQAVGEARASTASFRQGNAQRAEVNAMSPEERKAHEDKRAEQQRKRDDARMERERQRNAAKKGVAEASFDYTMKDLGNDYAGFPSNHSLKHKFLAKIKPEKQQLYKDKMNIMHEFDQLFQLFTVAKQRGDIIDQGVAEEFNPEYDDEAGSAEGNLHTIARAAQGLIDSIDDNENLPEWAQEKIAKVEGMLVAVWDYLESQEEQGIDPQVDEDWQKTNKQDKTDGMSPKAVKAYRRENPGSKLKTAVTTKPSKLKPGSKAAKRRKSFCARMSGNKGPMKDEKGRPTPKAKALRRWNCESVEQTVQILESVQRDLSEVKQRLDPKCWKGYKKQGTKMKGDTRVNNCVKVDEAEFTEDKLASDLYKDFQIFKKGTDKDIGSKAKDKEISSKAKDKEIQKKK